jgi:thioredoxin reductase
MILEAAIIGAGPYGLSIAAHLHHLGVNFRVFGKPMETWRSRMPEGMLLKSDGFASNLSAPAHQHSLGAYCARHAITYDDLKIPVSLTTFIAYGLEFQRQFVPTIDLRLVIGLHARGDNFELVLEDDEVVLARRVILAVGISHFDYTPQILAKLPAEMAGHSSAHHNLDCFKNRDVTVIGAGSSAVDLSALLHETGARVRLVARTSELRFGSPPRPGGRRRWQRLRHPQSGLGPGLRSRLACDLPNLFRYLPSPLRLEIIRRHLGPASAWYLRPRILGQVHTMLEHEVVGAEAGNGAVHLRLQSKKGSPATIETDHVIAATGYRADIDRLDFIDENLRSRIRRIGQMPELSSYFEASVPGLYFVGIAAAGSFGPLMRFVFGCDFASRRIAGHVVRSH